MRSATASILAMAVCPAWAGSLQDAEKELFAARYKNAARLYAAAVEADPAEADAYCGLVRSLLGDRRSREAYAVAAAALQKNPRTAGAQTAAGLAAFRGGNIGQAEDYFRAALRLDPSYAGALHGLASVEKTVSRFRTARDLLLAAYRSSPEDPQLMIARANTLRGTEHVAALREALAILDPGSEEAGLLRAHIAGDLAIGDREIRRLMSPNFTNRIKLLRFVDDPSRTRAPGVGVRAQLNQRQTVRLLLDTGTSGISVSPRIAERAGLATLGDQRVDAKGIGDQRTQSSQDYLASQVRIGDVVFADYPVSVFRSAQSSEYDGLIGADVFEAFLVTIDFPRMELSLDPRPEGPPRAFAEPVDAARQPKTGFQRVFRFGDHLAVPTRINGGKPTLFMIDTGSSETLIDDTIGREFSAMRADGQTTVTGIQGTVNRVSRADRVSLAFAGFRQDNASLVAIGLEKLSDSMGAAFGGILGMRALGQLTLTIDYREGAVRFERGR